MRLHWRDHHFLESEMLLGAVLLRKVVGCSVRGHDSEREMSRLVTDRTHKLSGTVYSVSGFGVPLLCDIYTVVLLNWYYIRQY